MIPPVMIGLGFDPDCNYFNDGITLTIETSKEVPEPTSSIILLCLGMVGLGNVYRRKKRP